MKKRIDLFAKTEKAAFYRSLAGPFAMGTLHLAALLGRFDWIVCNYCLFSYLMGVGKIVLRAVDRRKTAKSVYTAGVVTLALILAPMMASFVLTILYRQAPRDVFDWLVYAYALYGTVKIVLAVRGRAKQGAARTARGDVLTWLGLISAFYTIQMMEFRLVMFATDGAGDGSMYLMQLFTQGAIFLFCLFVAGAFFRRRAAAGKTEPDGGSRHA